MVATLTTLAIHLLFVFILLDCLPLRFSFATFVFRLMPVYRTVLLDVLFATLASHHSELFVAKVVFLLFTTCRCCFACADGHPCHVSRRTVHRKQACARPARLGAARPTVAGVAGDHQVAAGRWAS